MKHLTKEEKTAFEATMKKFHEENSNKKELNNQIKQTKQETIYKFIELINSIPAERLGDVDLNITEYELATRVTIDVELNKF